MRDWNRYVRERLELPSVKDARARDIQQEVAANLEEVYREALDRGMSPEEADGVARAHVPDWEAFADEVTRAESRHRRPPEDRWTDESADLLRKRGSRWYWLADFLQDIRYALRNLRASPGFTTVALITLALGLGGVATIFTLYDQVLVRPLPYDESEELVELWERLASFGNAMVAYPNYLDWKARNRSFEDMAVWNGGSMNLTGSGDPLEIDVLRISASTFPILRVEPEIGRNFLPEEDRIGAPGVLILSHSFWRDHLGSDPGVLGRTLILDEEPFSVVGVMPADFVFPSSGTEEDAYVPVEQFAEPWMEARGNHPGLLGLARLREGVTLAMAREDLEAIAVGLEKEYPDTNEGSRINSALLQERITRRASEPLTILLAAVVLLLLMACINVANLVLARTTARQQEMAVRVSLGAGTPRILRLLLTENLVLWTLGGIAGGVLAVFGVRGVVALLAEQIPPMFQVELDLRALLVVGGVSLATGLVFGLPPALRLVNRNLREHLKEGSRTTGGMGRARFRSALVVAEVSLAVALLVGAGLTLRSFSEVLDTSPGLNPEGVLVVGVNLPESRYPEEEERAAFYSRLLDQVRAIPGVRSAATSYNVPLGPGGWQNAFHAEGRPPEEGGDYSFAEVNSVSADYFATMEIPLVRGRAFTREDDLDQPRVVIVGQALAEEYWPGQDPIGKRLKWGGFSSENEWMEVIGVAGEVRVNGVTRKPFPQIYISHWQNNDDRYFLVVRSRGEPMTLAEPIRRAVLALDPAQPLASIGTMEGYIRESTRSAQLLALLMAIFAGGAISLAGVGIYGVMAHMTGERRHEIGIRVALGARGGQVLGLIFRQGLVMVGLGILIGLGLALAVGRLIASQLYQVSPTDALTFIATPLVVAAVAAVANLLPARRATRVDPVRALQAER